MGICKVVYGKIFEWVFLLYRRWYRLGREGKKILQNPQNP